jgi:hypothetical protein
LKEYQMQAIETRYKGYNFRSRLEARWVVFFDSLGYEWAYEKEGFEKDGHRYLPDFFLPGTCTWVEVKGSDELLLADAERIRVILEGDSPVPGVKGSYTGVHDWYTPAPVRSPGLLILGDIPNPRRCLTYHQLVQQDQRGLVFNWGVFSKKSLIVTPDLAAFFNHPADDCKWTTRVVQIDIEAEFQEVFNAYTAARSARFEHGQFGATS